MKPSHKRHEELRIIEDNHDKEDKDKNKRLITLTTFIFKNKK